MTERRKVSVTGGMLLLAVALTSGCVPQSREGFSSTAHAAARTATAALQAGFHSFLYVDATSVQLMQWSETSGGELTGVTDELQNLNPGSPTFISSNLAWTGTRRGRQILVTLPGVIILATLDGATLIRQVADSRTGEMVTERWVAGTLSDYTTLIQAFRAYVGLGVDLQGITFELQTAQQFPNPFTPARVQSYLSDAQNQLTSLHTLAIPHLPDLVLPWLIPSQEVDVTIAAAERFLGTPEPGTGQ